MIKIYDTKSRTKRPFEPIEEGKVGMYVCGPTVYNRIHIGNARTFISFDAIRRYLEWKGFEVTFVQNVTDVDDKIITKALQEGSTAADVAERFTQAFIDDMHAAGVVDPTVRPKATEEIDAMISLVERLIERGHAYEVEGDVYFAVRSYPDYGQLSGRNVDDMESGHRELRADGQGLEARKRDPLDFALWKAAKPGEPSWESPWGLGRPGWHIECSAMSEKYLGLPFDIHGGGADLAFPHHENERAQSEAAFDTTFANYWMHGGMLKLDNEKMSKSLGNVLLLDQVLEKVDKDVMRTLMLQAHYRSPLDFSDERLEEAAAALERIRNFLKNARWLAESAQPASNAQALSKPGAAAGDAARFDEAAYRAAANRMRADFEEAMDDDFNTAGALGAVFAFVGEANTLLAAAAPAQEQADAVLDGARAVEELLGVLGVSAAVSDKDAQDFSPELFDLAASVAGYVGADGEEALQLLLDARAEARVAKNFAVADAVRDGLADLGYRIEDTPQGARVSRAD